MEAALVRVQREAVDSMPINDIMNYLEWTKDAVEQQNVGELKEETDLDVYESLCRGEKRISPKVEKKLKCFYAETSKSPYEINEI
jgi:hypothetical protein